MGSRRVGVLSTGFAWGAGLGLLGPLAAVPASVLWWIGSRWTSGASVRWVLGVALTLHVGLGVSAFHSNDVHRYLWEGAVQLAGFSPYATAPSDEVLRPLRDARYAHVAHPELPSPYPPLAQASFALAAWVGLDELGYRNAILALNLLLAALLVAWLHASGRPVGRAAWFAWSPLALVAAVGGHVDVLMAAALLGFAWAWESGRARLAGALLGAAVLAKTVAVAVLPWALWRRPRAVLTTAVPVVLLGYLPYAGAGSLLGSLPTFAREFQFNAIGFAGLASVLGDGAVVAAALLLAAVVGVVALRVDAPADAAALTLMALLLLAPVVHYWYLTWFLVLLPAVANRAVRWGGLAWVLAIATLAPAYVAIAAGDPPPPDAWPRAIQLLLPLAVVGFALWRGRDRDAPLATRGEVLCAS